MEKIADIVYTNFYKGKYRRLLSVGCGPHGWRHSQFAVLESVPIKIGIDFNYDKLDAYRYTDWAVLWYDLNCGVLPFIDNYFDIVIGLDVIEHLEKDRGMFILDEMERVGKNVLIYTPEGFFDTVKLQPEHVKNELDFHRSAWFSEDFNRRGYIVEKVGPILEDCEEQYYGLYAFLGK